MNYILSTEHRLVEIDKGNKTREKKPNNCKEVNPLFHLPHCLSPEALNKHEER